MLERTIHLIGGDDEETATIVFDRNDRNCHLTLNYRERSISASATDFFDAFCDIRTALEKDRLIPFCYGASLNVFPSGICRDMGAGLKAYKFKNGTKPTRSDLVDIFDAGPDIIPVFVSVQREHFAAWLNSIGAAKPPNMI